MRQSRADAPFIMGIVIVWCGIIVGRSLSFIMLSIVAVSSTMKAVASMIFSCVFLLANTDFAPLGGWDLLIVEKLYHQIYPNGSNFYPPTGRLRSMKFSKQSPSFKFVAIKSFTVSIDKIRHKKT